MKHIVIVGGGFTGVTTAVDIAKKRLKDIKITLVTPRSYFDYYPGLFHLLTGFSVKQLAIPYDYIFEGTGIIHEKTEVTSINQFKKYICTGKDTEIHFDYLVLAPGSVTNYFDMGEFKDKLHTVTTVDDVLELRRSIHEMLTISHFDQSKSSPGGEVIVIGGGPNGTESAAEVAILVKQVADAYQIDPTTVHTSLYVSGDRVTPMFDAQVSDILHKKLVSLGVDVVYNKRVTPDEMKNELMPDVASKNRLVIWSTGMKLAPLASQLTGFQKDKRGKMIVDEYLRAKLDDGTVVDSVFVGGDLACTEYSGLAQTAHHDGHAIAQNIIAHIQRRSLHTYRPKNLGYIIAMGRDWSLFVKGKLHLSGRLIWYLRRLVDLKSYLQILPISKAIAIFRSEHETWQEFDTSARQRMEEKYKQKKSG